MSADAIMDDSCLLLPHRWSPVSWAAAGEDAIILYSERFYRLIKARKETDPRL